MQISPSDPALIQPSTGTPITPGKNSKTVQNGKQESPGLTGAGKTPPSAEGTAIENISLSPAARSQEAAHIASPIYAEIWKGAIKIAEVDIHGHVTSFSALVSPGGGGGIAGQIMAAQRAVQVAQQIGGEIRTAGQSLDSQTILMRARLASTYAV